MNIYTGLLFQQGYISDPKLAMSLAGAATTDGQARSSDKSADRGESRSAKQPEKRAHFRRGAIFDVCSVSLSAFR